MKIDQLRAHRALAMRTETAKALGAVRAFRGDVAKSLRRLNSALKRVKTAAQRYEKALDGDIEIMGAPDIPTMTFLANQLNADLTSFQSDLTAVFAELQDHEKTLKKRRGRRARVDLVDAREAKKAARLAAKKASAKLSAP